MEIKVVATRDAFLQNDCIVFDRAQAAHLVDAVPDIAAMCVICAKEELPRDLVLMDKTCAEHAARILFDNSAVADAYRVWVFASHGPWQPSSAIVRRKRLWASVSIDSELNILRRSDEIIFESKEGLRYAGVVQIGADSLFAATQLLRRNPSYAIIVSKRPDISSENGVKALFKGGLSSPARGSERQKSTGCIFP